MRIKEVYNIAMPIEKRKEEKFNVWVSLFVRPFSILLTFFLLKTRIKPITITAISIIFSLLGFMFLAFGGSIVFALIGWSMFFLWAVLDGVDGNLARCQKACSKRGDLWDTTGGYAAMVLIYFSAGIASFYDNNLCSLFDSHYLLILGGATALFSIFPRLVMHKKKSAQIDSESVKALSDKKAFSFSKIVAMNLISPSGFMQVIFLICIIFHLLNFFIVFYAFINFCIMCLSLYRLLGEKESE